MNNHHPEYRWWWWLDNFQSKETQEKSRKIKKLKSENFQEFFFENWNSFILKEEKTHQEIITNEEENEEFQPNQTESQKKPNDKWWLEKKMC